MAIAFDAKTNSTEQLATSSVTLSMTIGGGLTNSILVVGSTLRNSGGAAYGHITGITWNTSENLTSAKRQDGITASRYLTAELWYVKNPTSGTHNIVVTYDRSVDRTVIGGISFQGVDQTSPIDATAGDANTAGVPFDVTITTVADNAWLVNALFTAHDTALSPDHGETTWWNISTANTDQAVAAYKGPITPAGATVTGWSDANTGADEGAMAVISLKPAASAATAVTFITYRPPWRS